MPRLAVASLLALACLLTAAPAADAARFGRCPDADLEFVGTRCARVAVPLDRSGRVPGRVELLVARTDLARRPRRVVLALTGGPGQAAVPFTFNFMVTIGESLGAARLVTFDQRGTGRSGLIRCRELEQAADAFNDPGAAAACAERLGPRRGLYTTRASAEDIEAVRRAVGAERLVIYGVSYGTKVALEYARIHPERVERLVLDSALEPEGPDPFYRDTLQAGARILRDLCPGGCPAVSADPVADLSALVGRLASAPIDDNAYDARGRRRGVRIDGFALASILLAGDFAPDLRAGFPAAVVGALRGDGAPAARLARRAAAVENDLGPVRLFSPGLYAATICEEAPLPWARDAAFEDRPRQAAEAAAAQPASAFAPFDAATALGSDFLATCARWPAAAPPPELVGALPAIPTLVVQGEEDLRTPLEGGARLAGRIGGGVLLPVANASHSVLGAPEPGCPERALARFLRGQATPPRCRRPASRLPLRPIAPLSLAELAPARGSRGRRGRTVTAVARTLFDVGDEIEALITSGIVDEDEEPVRGGGLRGGRFFDSSRGVVLRGVEYVPGVVVSGLVRPDRRSARLRVGGSAAARGTLAIRGGRVSGRLGGRRVRARVPRGTARLATAAPAPRASLARAR